MWADVRTDGGENETRHVRLWMIVLTTLTPLSHEPCLRQTLWQNTFLLSPLVIDTPSVSRHTRLESW